MKKLYFTNPNGRTRRKCVSKVVSKLHNDLTVKESEIVVLLGQVLGIYGKKESSVRKEHLFHHGHCLRNDNGGYVRK